MLREGPGTRRFGGVSMFPRSVRCSAIRQYSFVGLINPDGSHSSVHIGITQHLDSIV